MAAPFVVENATPGTQVWSVDASGNTVQSGNLTVAGTTISGVTINNGTVNNNGIVIQNAGVNTAGGQSTVLTTLLIGNMGAAGTQIPDTTRDYMCYVTSIGGGAGNTLTIGPNSTATTATIFANATITSVASLTYTWRLPAAWYVRFNGTATLGVQTGLPA